MIGIPLMEHILSVFCIHYPCHPKNSFLNQEIIQNIMAVAEEEGLQWTTLFCKATLRHKRLLCPLNS